MVVHDPSGVLKRNRITTPGANAVGHFKEKPPPPRSSSAISTRESRHWTTMGAAARNRNVFRRSGNTVLYSSAMLPESRNPVNTGFYVFLGDGNGDFAGLPTFFVEPRSSSTVAHAPPSSSADRATGRRDARSNA